MIISIDKDAMTAQVQLYRGANEDIVHDISWWSMNPDVSRMYGSVRTQVLTLPIKEVVDWFGEDMVVLDTNHRYIYGQYGELRDEVHIDPSTILAISVRDDYLFRIGSMANVNLCIGVNYIKGAK